MTTQLSQRKSKSGKKTILNTLEITYKRTRQFHHNPEKENTRTEQSEERLYSECQA